MTGTGSPRLAAIVRILSEPARRATYTRERRHDDPVTDNPDDPIAQRLQRAQEHLIRAREAAELALQHRDEIIAIAHDELGVPIREIARLVGVSQRTVQLALHEAA